MHSRQHLWWQGFACPRVGGHFSEQAACSLPSSDGKCSSLMRQAGDTWMLSCFHSFHLGHSLVIKQTCPEAAAS